MHCEGSSAADLPDAAAEQPLLEDPSHEASPAAHLWGEEWTSRISSFYDFFFFCHFWPRLCFAIQNTNFLKANRGKLHPEEDKDCILFLFVLGTQPNV